MSRAYVRVVAAQAGVTCTDLGQDYGFDLLLRGVEKIAGEFWDSGGQLDVQVRSTTRAEEREAGFVYDLDVRTYNLLCRVGHNRPCILVLVLLPADRTHWLSQSEEELILRRCAYWMSFRDAAPTENEATVRIVIPRANVFSVEAVRHLTQHSGEAPT